MRLKRNIGNVRHARRIILVLPHALPRRLIQPYLSILRSLYQIERVKDTRWLGGDGVKAL